MKYVILLLFSLFGLSASISGRVGLELNLFAPISLTNNSVGYDIVIPGISVLMNLSPCWSAEAGSGYTRHSPKGEPEQVDSTTDNFTDFHEQNAYVQAGLRHDWGGLYATAGITAMFQRQTWLEDVIDIEYDTLQINAVMNNHQFGPWLQLGYSTGQGIIVLEAFTGLNWFDFKDLVIKAGIGISIH
jgi:hypothetical protein